MGEGKCTFGTKMPINLDMLNEIIYREVKFFRNYTIYTPNFESNPVAGKFYAAHDMIKPTADEEEKVTKYQHSITASRRKGPCSKYPQPLSENQIYGWYQKPLVEMDRNDRRFYKPRCESEHTKIEDLIRKLNPKSKK